MPGDHNAAGAKGELEEYRALFGTSKDAEVKAITTKIDSVLDDIKDEGALKVIRECWNKTVRLFENATSKTAQSTDPASK